MRIFKGLFAVVAFSAVSFAADSWNGTLIDVMCKGKGADPAEHTRQCAIGCAKGGYGLILSDGKFVKFDEAGNAKALAALKASKKENALKAKVTGTLHEDTVHVDSITLE